MQGTGTIHSAVTVASRCEKSSSSSSSGSGSRRSRSGASTSESTRVLWWGAPPPRISRRRRLPASKRSSRRLPLPHHSSRLQRRSPGRRSRSPGRRSRSPGRRSRSPGRRSPSQHSESSVEQSLQIIVGNDCYVIDSPERKRTSDRLGSPADSDVNRNDLADGPIFSRGLSPRSLEQYPSLQENSSSPFNVRHDADYRSMGVFIHQSDYSVTFDHLRDQPRETDSDGELLRKSLYSSEDRGQEPKHPRYDRDDRLLDMNMEPQGFLPAVQTYCKQSLSGSPSPTYLDEDFYKLESARRKREEEELSRNSSRELPGSGYMIPGSTNPVQTSEPRYLYRPDDAPAMPKKSILKKRMDDPFVQNSGSFLEQKELHELTLEPVDRHSDFLLPHERVSQDESGFSRILGMMADSQEKRRHSFPNVIEDEEKFLYGNDDGSNVNSPSTQKLTLSGEREYVSQKVSSPSPPSPSEKPEASEESRPEDEKIHDLLKTIGLDIGVAEIGKLAARTQERLHGKKPSRSPDRHLVASHKPESRERRQSLSSIHSLESSQKCALSPSGSYLPSKDMSSFSNFERNRSKTVEQDNPAGTPEQSVPPISLIPSAPPSLPNLCHTPTSFSWYSDPHFSPFTATQLPQNYPLPTMPSPGYDAYGHYITYAASGWPMYAQQADPAPSAVHELVTPRVPPNHTRPNLRAIKRASPGKGTPDIKGNYVQTPTTAPSSNLLSQFSQSSCKGVKERISDERNRTSQKQRIMEERKKLMAKQAARQRKLHYLKIELNRLSKQQEEMLQKKRKEIDPLLVEVNRLQEKIAKLIAQHTINADAAEKKQSELDKVAQILGINIFEKSRKISSENKDSGKNNSENAESEEITSNPIKDLDRRRGVVEHQSSDGAPANGFPGGEAVTPNQDSKQDAGQSSGPNPGGARATAARSRTQSIPGPSYTAESLPLSVWICGHNIPFWAHNYALMTGLGESLGISHLATVRWFNKCGMEWDAMMPHLFELALKELPPQMLVIHLGENDLARITSTELISSVTQYFHQIKTLFPNVMIVWVEMIPSRFWTSAAHRARKEANYAISQTISQLGGQTIRQPFMNSYAAHLFQEDGVNLSRTGCDQYLKNLVRGITTIITGVVGHLKGAKQS